MPKYALMIVGLLLCTSAVSVARPKTLPAKCSCMCVTSSGFSDRKSYNNPGTSCGTFENKTCNIDNPQNGLVEPGTLTSCGTVSTGKGGSTKGAATGTRQQ
jgi:hypothetical protein